VNTVLKSERMGKPNSQGSWACAYVVTIFRVTLTVNGVRFGHATTPTVNAQTTRNKRIGLKGLNNDMRKELEALRNLANIPHPSLGIDLDGCVDEAPIFFSILTNRWPGKVFVITFRDDKDKAEEVLKRYNIRYDEVVLVNTFDQKAEVIAEKGILVYFDDQPEMLKNIPGTVGVMLVRNEGNYDYDEKKWTLSKDTGRLIN
jgi:hypothetical protein